MIHAAMEIAVGNSIVIGAVAVATIDMSITDSASSSSSSA